MIHPFDKILGLAYNLEMIKIQSPITETQRKQRARASFIQSLDEETGLHTFIYHDSPVPAHRHINPDGSTGGWVAETAYVAPTAFLAEHAYVYDRARVTDKA
jgi:hypothetical protein